MNRREFGLVVVSAAALSGALLIPSQSPTPRASAAPTATPTNPVPDYVMTPGAAVLTPSAAGKTTPGATGGYGANLFGLPPAIPTYSISPGTGATSATPTGRPRSAADCANGRWRTYGLAFTNEQNCRDWAGTHPPGTSETGTAGAATTPSAAPTGATPTPPPTPRDRKGRTTPPMTPGISMRPPATPLPILRARYAPPLGDAAPRTVPASARSATSAS